MDHRIIFGDALDVLRTLDAESVDMCATSPPYWGLRDYGHEGQIGLEETPEAYVARLVEVFAEVRRVLKPGGTCWVNLGDSYASNAKGDNRSAEQLAEGPHTLTGGQRFREAHATGVRRVDIGGLKPKDLCGIPWRVAFALQADGWYLRRDIIWAKGVSGQACEAGWHGSCMPESAEDRPTSSHEYVFLLTKQPRYWYDYFAVREKGALPAGTRAAKGSAERAAEFGVNARPPEYAEYDGQRNMRSVWTYSPRPFSGAHFACWPPDLVERMILAGCPPKVCAGCGEPREHRVEKTGEKVCSPDLYGRPRAIALDGNGETSQQQGGAPAGFFRNVTRDLGYHPACACNADALPGLVLDPFCGSGTTTQVARKLGRRSIGIELNPEYEAVMRERLDLPAGGSLFADEDLGVEFVTIDVAEVTG